MEYAFPRTQNSVEAWYRRWDTLVGSAHIGVFKIIKKLQKEQNQVELEIEVNVRGAPQHSQRKPSSPPPWVVAASVTVEPIYGTQNEVSEHL
ncbi:6965_t:CDS:2 [Paraglomus brasilianum]|uniref:6965_t:CDS:1 n=1 Tax=Paraglomus brasilianum TaxID=144538 RepID=A0A9N9CC74_9GLOM|nr:6965_t:CDS:2 [Paraglomus brasilianum]